MLRLDPAAKIIEAIKLAGPRNVSELHRVTGIPVETCRYIIKHRLPKAGISVSAKVNYSALGLRRMVGKLWFTKETLRFSEDVLNILGKTAYLYYYARLIPNNHYICLFSIPENMQNSFYELLNTLKDLGILADFKVNQVAFLNILSMTPQYFNFLRKRWEVPWDRLTIRDVELEDKEIIDFAVTDYIDLLIVKELQKDAFQKLLNIAHSIGLDRSVISYHYKWHVIRNRLISGYIAKWFPRFPSNYDKSVVKLILEWYDFSNNAFRKIHNLIHTLPYTYSELLTMDRKMYVVHMFLPPYDLNNCLSFLFKYKTVYAECDWYFIDDSSSLSFSLPYELFDREINRWIFSTDLVVKNLRSEIKKRWKLK